MIGLYTEEETLRMQAEAKAKDQRDEIEGKKRAEERKKAQDAGMLPAPKYDAVASGLPEVFLCTLFDAL